MKNININIKMSSNKSLAEEIYAETAAFGKIWALISVIMGTIIGVALLIIGIYILTLKSEVTKVSATITKINNSTTNICQDFNCTITVTYTYNDIEETKDVNNLTKKVYRVGDNIDIYIDNKGSISMENSEIPKTLGVVLIIISIVILPTSWFWYYASKKYKTVAATQGVSGILSIIR